jgi:4-amino-4-deoxy-L-arabinose transferase-like glycosyltransferase
MTPAADRRDRAIWLALLGLALLAGAFLRCYQLDAQILLDDEWHAINKLLHAGAHDIATHFGFADYSIPLTLYFRFLYLHGGLTEWGMRLPMLLAGIGLLLAAPWLARASISRPVRAVWVGLMALSPMMVYHTRTARPYAITTLLCVVAIFAFRHWWRGSEGRWRWAALYVAAAFLSGYLHLITLAFALAPFIFYGVVALGDCANKSRREQGLRELRDVIVLGVVTVLPLAAALLPPLINDWSSLAAKAGTDSVTLHSGYRTLLICFGIANPWLLAIGVVLCAAGVHRAWRRERELVAYLGFVVLVAIAAIAASHATWLQHPLNFARYIQPMVPFLLLALAEGIVAVLSLVPSPLGQGGLAGMFLAGVYLAGPIPGYLYNPNQFMGDPYFQFDYDPAWNPYLTTLPHGPIPDFYRQLGNRPPRSLTLIETPWSLETDSDPQPLYQAVHRQYIKIALTTPECGVADYGNYPDSATGMRLDHFVHLSQLLRGETAGADFLVVHLRSWPKPAKPPPQWPDMAATCLPQIEQHFGAPVYRDTDIEVFALSPAGAGEH